MPYFTMGLRRSSALPRNPKISSPTLRSRKRILLCWFTGMQPEHPSTRLAELGLQPRMCHGKEKGAAFVLKIHARRLLGAYLQKCQSNTRRVCGEKICNTLKYPHTQQQHDTLLHIHTLLTLNAQITYNVFFGGGWDMSSQPSFSCLLWVRINL